MPIAQLLPKVERTESFVRGILLSSANMSIAQLLPEVESTDRFAQGILLTSNQ